MVESQARQNGFVDIGHDVQREPFRYRPVLQVRQAVDLRQVWHDEWQAVQLDPKYPSLQVEQKVELVHLRQFGPHFRHFWPPDT